MIFSYLTDTKCYFVDNTNKKISETYYKWLANCKFIKEYDKPNNEEIRDIELENEFKKVKKEILIRVKGV